MADRVSITCSGYRPYIDIGELDPGCKIIIKSPANTDIVGCGYMIASFSQPTCAVLDLKKTFMAQFCCGLGDCARSGAGKLRRSVKFGGSLGEPLDVRAAGGGMYSLVFRDANGTEIAPAQVGHPPEAVVAGRSTELGSAGLLAKRGCDGGSWRPDS